MHALDGAFRLVRAEVLPRHRRGGAHQPDRRPRDQRKQLGVADGIRGLGRGALLQPADEAQQRDAGQVHRNALDPSRQPEAEERADDHPVGLEVHVPGELDDQLALEQQVEGDEADGAGGDDRAHGRAGRPIFRHQNQVEDQVEQGHRHAQPERCAGVARGPQRRTEHEEQQHADAEHEIDAQERQRLRLHRRRGVDHVQQVGGQEIAERPHHRIHRHGGQKRLINRAVHLLGLAGADEPGHQHRLAREQRGHEDDDDEEDLPADADGRISGVTDEVTHQDVVNHPLETGDHVLNHGGPRQFPDGGSDGAFDERTIERVGLLLRWCRRVGHREGLSHFGMKTTPNSTPGRDRQFGETAAGCRPVPAQFGVLDVVFGAIAVLPYRAPGRGRSIVLRPLPARS